MSKFDNPCQRTDVLLLNQRVEPVCKMRFAIRARIRKQPPMPRRPIEIKAAAVIGIRFGQACEQRSEHGPVTTGKHQRADKPQFGFLPFVEPWSAFWRKAQPTLFVKFQRGRPIQAHLITNGARRIRKMELLSWEHTRRLWVIILNGQKSVNRQLSRASKILIRLKIHTSIRTLVEPSRKD